MCKSLLPRGSSRARLVAAIVALGLSIPALGHAQTADPQVIATAQALYEQAAAEMDAKRYASACPKLEEVTRLVPEGLGAKLTLGECYEGMGRLASAWSQLAIAEALAAKLGQSERAQQAAQRAAALKPRLATLSIGVSHAIRAIPGLRITRDGVVVGQGQWGTPLPIDAGDHEVIVTAPGYSTWTKRLNGVVDGKRSTLLVDELVALAPESTPSSPTAAAPTPTASAATPPEEPPPQRPWQRPVVVTAMGLGGAGVVVGAVLGGLAVAKNGDSKQDGRCDASNRCDQAGLDLRDGARSLGTGSTVAIVVGGVLLTTGVVLFATAPSTSRQERSARLELAPGGLLARGTW